MELRGQRLKLNRYADGRRPVNTLESSREPSRFQYGGRSTSTLPADIAVTDGALRQTFGRLTLSGGRWAT